MFFLLYKHTDDGILMIFRRFPTTLRRFPRIFQNCCEGQTNVPKHFPRISEDARRLPKTFEEDPKMFRWYTNEFKYNLREKLDITESIDIFTCEDIISSHVRISYRFYQFVTTRYTTDFYIIKIYCSTRLDLLCLKVRKGCIRPKKTKLKRILCKSLEKLLITLWDQNCNGVKIYLPPFCDKARRKISTQLGWYLRIS